MFGEKNVFHIISMVVEMVSLKGGIGGIFDPPEGKDYISGIQVVYTANWGIICHRSHLLGETRNNH